MRVVNINTLAANIFDELLNNEVLLFYYGELDFDISNQIIKNLSKKLKGSNISRKDYNSIYASFAEAIENAYRHQKKITSSQIGLILISKNNNSYYISVGNPIEISKRIDIDNRFNSLKNKSESELKDLVKAKIAGADINNDKSASMGLIKIMLNTKQKTSVIFKELVKNELLFILQMKIDL